MPTSMSCNAQIYIFLNVMRTSLSVKYLVLKLIKANVTQQKHICSITKHFIFSKQSLQSQLEASINNIKQYSKQKIKKNSPTLSFRLRTDM